MSLECRKINVTNLFLGELHIMISYQWDVKQEVLKFRRRLAEAGYRVWIDVEQMHTGKVY